MKENVCQLAEYCIMLFVSKVVTYVTCNQDEIMHARAGFPLKCYPLIIAPVFLNAWLVTYNTVGTLTYL